MGKEALNCKILQRQEAEAHAQALSEALDHARPKLFEMEHLCRILQRLHMSHVNEHGGLLRAVRHALVSGKSATSFHDRIAYHESVDICICI